MKRFLPYGIITLAILLAIPTTWVLSKKLNGNEPVEAVTRQIESEYTRSIFEIIRTTAPRGEAGFGTAFVVSKKPLEGGQFLYELLTCAHVADDADLEETGWELRQPLISNELMQPRLIQIDPITDIALFEATLPVDLPVVTFSKTSALRRLEPVVAIGNTRGRGIATVTGQITDPQKGLETYPLPVFQTNIAVAPGNSGSPIFNLKKEVIGIYFRYDTQAMGFVSFNIPTAEVVRSWQALQQSQEGVSYGDWGIVIQALEPKQRGGLIGNRASGVFVSKVYPGSSAEAAGLMAGDVILKVADRDELTEINKDSDLYKLTSFVMKGRPEDPPVPLEILRNAEAMRLEIKRGSLLFARRPSYHTGFGFSVVELEADDQRQYSLPSLGVWTVFDSEPKEGRWLHGTLYNRSLITHLNDLPVESVDDFKKGLDTALAQKGERPYLMLRSYQSSRQYFSTPDRWLVVRIDLGS